MNLATSVDDRKKPCDRTALLMMLAYVQAECRRIGADGAAEHAAIAAALIEDGGEVPSAEEIALH